MRISTVALFLFFAALSANAQEVRATLSGIVTDSSGAAVVGATVSARNTNTNLSVSTLSNTSGAYFLPPVPSGPYELIAELPGFRKYSRTGITLAVADKATIDIRLEVGAMTESVTVSGELTGAETSGAITGQLLNAQQVADIPLNGRNFITMLNLSAGVAFTQKVGPNVGWVGTRQWENGAYAGAFSMNGGKANTNAFFVDGSALGVEGGVTWIPLNDAIEEVKVSSPTSDASLGLSGGGVVNVIMKGGTNQFHGVLSEFIRNNKFEALQTQIRRSGATAAKHIWNSYSAMVSGPIIKNKFFFSAGYDGFTERQPWSAVQTVPTALERTGNFTQTFNAAGQNVVIFDPLTTRQVEGRFVREPFAGNVVPNARVSQLARSYMQFYPLPNARGDAPTTTRNFVDVTNAHLGNDAWHVKSEYLWSERHRTSATVTQNWGYANGARNGLQIDNPAGTGANPLLRVHYGAILDHTWTPTPSMVVNGRLSWDRWAETSTHNLALTYDGSSLGFQGAVSPVGTRFPAANVTGMMALGYAGPSFRPDNNYTALVDISQSVGRHLIKTGFKVIEGRYNFWTAPNLMGGFNFTSGFTQRDPQLAEPTSGYAFGSFLLGNPATGSVNIVDSIAALTRTYSTYIQDDFKVSNRLTLNFGLRWDIQTPPVERFNRSVRTFDPNVSYTLNGAAAKGGLVFANQDNRGRYGTDYSTFQPRLGVAYKATTRMVIRASYGLTMLPNNFFGGLGSTAIDQTGYSRTTPFVATLGAGLDSFIPNRPGTGRWENPFPGGFLQPFGATLGSRTNVGQSVSYVDPGYRIPRVHQFNLGLEFELPGRMTLANSYVGSRTRKFPISRETNIVPLNLQLESLGVANYWNRAVANPFFGEPLLAGSGYAGSTITNALASTRYPQFSGVNQLGISTGGTNYNSLQTRLSKRLSKGLNFSANYTFSKMVSSTFYRTNWDNEPTWQIDPLDATHHFALSTFYDLPFGKNGIVGANWNKALDRIAGGWSLNFTVEKLTGIAIPMPGIPVNDALSSAPTDGRFFNTCSQLTNGARFNCSSATESVYWRQPNFNEILTYSTLWAQVREPSRAIWNISMFKKIPITERVGAEFRAEAYNAFNTPQYNAPNTTITNALFGRVVPDQYNFPRAFQFALRLKF